MDRETELRKAASRIIRNQLGPVLRGLAMEGTEVRINVNQLNMVTIDYVQPGRVERVKRQIAAAYNV